MEQDQQNNNGGNEEVDVLELIVKNCWKHRLTILAVTAGFFVFGFFAALFCPREFTSSVTFVPQSNQSLNSSYSSIASAMGLDLDLGVKGGHLTPKAYPFILDNVNFEKDLMYVPIQFSDRDTLTTLYDYYTNPSNFKFNLVGTVAKYTVGLPRLLSSKVIKPKPVVYDWHADTTAVADSADAPSQKIPLENITRLTKEESDVAQVIQTRVKMEVNPKDGYLTITTLFPDALATAQVCQASFDLLKKYISDFKVAKSRQNMEYIEGQYLLAKADYERKLRDYAYFLDSNVGILTAQTNMRKSHYQSEMELARQLYSELAKNLSAAKVKVSEDTVVLTDVSPVYVPNKKSKPNTVLVILVWTFLGVCVGYLVAMIKERAASRKNRKEEALKD